MPATEARVSSRNARRYLAQLCKHFAHKVAVDWDESRGDVDFGFGACRMTADGESLRLACSAGSDRELGKVKLILEDHLRRFGWREELVIDWTAPAESR